MGLTASVWHGRASRLRVLAATAPGRLTLTAAILGIGLTTGLGVNVDGLVNSQAYLYLICGLLAIGLYSSARGIELAHLRTDWRVVLFAVTLGVILKAVLISVVVLLVFRRPEFLVLGVAVAQIDPLSVAALQGSSRMTERGKVLLLAWASFDDPVTMLLTIYASAVTLSLYPDIVGSASGNLEIGGLTDFTLNLGANLALALGVFLVWILGRVAIRAAQSANKGWARPGVMVTVECVLVGVVLYLAVLNLLMLAVALVGLFLRPAHDRLVGRLAGTAFLIATFVLGMLLVLGMALLPGLVLGAAAFFGQAIVSRLVTRGQHGTDRVYFAVAQQNGITAIILALLLETGFTGTVAVVGPAIVVINLLHLTTNAVYSGRNRKARRLMLDTIGRGLEESCACPPGYAATQVGATPRCLPESQPLPVLAAVGTSKSANEPLKEVRPSASTRTRRTQGHVPAPTRTQRS